MNKEGTKRSVSLIRLTLLVGSRLPLTGDKEKTAHTLAYSASRGPNAYITNTERLGLFFQLGKLSRFTSMEKLKTLLLICLEADVTVLRIELRGKDTTNY